MALRKNIPLPTGDPVTKQKRKDKYGPKESDPLEGTLSDAWGDYLTDRDARIDKSTGRIASVTLTDQGTPSGPTDMTDATITNGIYRLSYYLCVVQASGAGVQLDVKFTWQDRSITRTWTSDVVNPTTLTAFTADSFLLRVDNLSPVSYETEYDGDKFFDLVAVLEEVQA